MKNKKLTAFALALSVVQASTFFLNTDVNAATTNNTTNNISSVQENKKSTAVLIKSGKKEPFKPTGEVKSHAEVALMKKPATQSQSDPLSAIKTTVTGKGGSATIDPGYSSIRWKVKPTTKWPYVFTGYVEVKYYDGQYETYEVSGEGVLGSSCSGAVPVVYRGGYSVTFEGAAADITGEGYVVLPGCEAGYGV
ncbi:hypothetical protein CLPUN_10320 [Clostridium puniceum]|uniref:Uncharacterized protein n=1 Tax=Clostridium puniceum TaxID=29367 RepID=A0A1S8TV07_9CLOT|nr:hypothetical protein [Clostridium puniceum]OOM81643.1 hypothetical protein CLPUN_10320 [Clostridium puniceum]